MSNLPCGPLIADVAGFELGAEEREFLTHPALGGVILFSRNFESREQVRALVRQIHDLRDPALLVAVDHEGGRVQRFREEFTLLPAANRLAGVYDRDRQQGMALARAAGSLMAGELAGVGIDLSFAPVLDLPNPRSEVIGDRGFHHDPHAICALAGAYIDGMNQAGMAATGKHFPGHGGVEGDSHHLLPVDTRTLEELMASDLVPFRKLADRLGGVMTAHVAYPAVDRHIPTYSATWLNDVLRNQLGFRGLVFSDDLTMKGAHHAHPVENGLDQTEGRNDGQNDDQIDVVTNEGAGDRCLRALAAGCDMVLVCNDPASAHHAAEAIGERSTPDAGLVGSLRRGPSDLDHAMLPRLAEQVSALV